MSEYKVGDEVLLKVKVIGIEEDEYAYPYKVEFEDESIEWFEEKTLISAEDSYNKGLEDAWELAKRLSLNLYKNGLSNDEINKIYGMPSYRVFEAFTPQEALAKLKAYEEQRKIEAGDVVLIYGEEAVVTRVVDGHANILFGDGVTNNLPVKELVGDKTGKHINIESFLKQLRG